MLFDLDVYDNGFVYYQLPDLVHALPGRLWPSGALSRTCSPLYIERYRGPRSRYPPQAHDFWELTATVKGTVTVECTVSLQLQPPMVCLMPPGCLHREWAPDEVETLWLGFHRRATPRDGRSQPAVASSQALTALMEQLWLFATTTAGRIGPELDAQTANILHRFLRLSSDGGGDRTGDNLQHAVEFIAGHYADELNMREIAHHYGYSEGHFYRSFKGRMGLPPNAYLTRLRVQFAARLLCESSLPVKEIGARVGVPDEAYFSRLFRKAHGVCPSVFRAGSACRKIPSMPSAASCGLAPAALTANSTINSSGG